VIELEKHDEDRDHDAEDCQEEQGAVVHLTSPSTTCLRVRRRCSAVRWRTSVRSPSSVSDLFEDLVKRVWRFREPAGALAW
jgi:hypothetical protein